MSKPDDRGSVDESPEQTAELIGRREALGRFAKYTAPALLAMLAATEAMASVSND